MSMKVRSFSGRFRMSAVAAGFSLFAVAAVATPTQAAGSHMSPHLTYVQGPGISSLTSNAISRGCAFAPSASCYGPHDLAKVYNFPSNLDGRGQTIILVEAYGSPTIAADLARFDRYFGVPAPPSFKIIHAKGTLGVTGSNAFGSWQIETSLDVEYAHAMAPGAKIVLAVAATDNNFDMNAAEAQVFPRYPGAIVSQSFGDWETDPTAGTSFAEQHKIFEAATRLGDTLLASAGDFGATWTPVLGTTYPLASYPASDPLVTSVGGTQGNPYPGGLEKAGAYGGEATWNEPQFHMATGGAPSILFGAPSWQRRVTGYPTRTIPDVAYDAAVNGGVQVIVSPITKPNPCAPFVTCIDLVGGTSVGSPQWAAIFALVNQARASGEHDPLGFANAALYKLGTQGAKSDGNAQNAQGDEKKSSSAVFHDITSGNNALFSPIGFSAKVGYDLTTGWGTPDVANVVAALTGSGSDRNPEANDPASVHGSSSNNGHAANTMAPD
jgi:subtilase family serine protease